MLLSTKLLTSAQEKLARALGLVVKSVSLLSIELHGSAAQPAWSQSHDGWAITSRNAVRALAEHLPEAARHRPVAAVGTKTAIDLQSLGLAVMLEADGASQLAQRIEAAGWQHIAFFCGNRRRDELPTYLRSRGAQVDEYVVYATRLQPQKFALNEYVGVLFFSPSGVEALLQANQWPQTLQAYAIGPTTAAAFEAATDQAAAVAPEPTVESLLRLAAP